MTVLRDAMAPVTRAVRAYFAPVDRNSGTPSVFDPAAMAAMDLAAPPAPWLDLGEVSAFKRTALTAMQPLRSGSKSAMQTQFRAGLRAQVSFEFMQWGKLQLALSCGCQQMNLLAEAASASPRPSGSAAAAAKPLLSGPSATELIVGSGAVDSFAVGDLVAADIDYTGELGYVGNGVSAAFVRSPADVASDPDYIRRVTFNVGRVVAKTATSLLLAQPFIGGVPAAGASVQKVIGFVDREGGSFLQEWSALFAVLAESGSRTFYHYPRLQAATAAGETRHSFAPELQLESLAATFEALPTTDPNDNEPVLCYRTFIPAAGSALY